MPVCDHRGVARPILLTRPWSRAWFALHHRLGLLVTSLVVGVIVGLVAAAPVLFVSSVGAGAVQTQYGRSCPASLAPTLRVAYLPQSGAVGDPLDRLREAVAEDPSFAEPERIVANYAANVATVGDRRAMIGFLARDGFLDHVEVIGPSTDGDVWLPHTLQAELDVAPGDTIDIELRDGRLDQLTVAGVFRDLASAPLDSYWCAATKAIMPENMYGEIFPPPMALVEPATFDDHDLRAGLLYSRYVAEFAAPPLTVADATRLTVSTQAVTERVRANGLDDSVSSGIDRLERRARLVREAVRDTTLPVAGLAIVSALCLAGVLGVVWGRSRRNTCVALATLGVSPAAIGAKAMIETALAVLGGALGGAWLCRASMTGWAPATQIEPGAMAVSVGVAVAAAAVGVVLVGVSAGLSSRSLLRVAAPARRSRWRFVPFELGLVGLAWWAATDIQPGAVVPLEGRRVVDTSASALLLPLAVLTLGAVLVARLWWWLTGRRRSASSPKRLARRLALRRLQFGSKAGSALLGAGTLAVGVSVFGLAMSSSLERTGEAKAAVFVGSDVALLIAGELPAGAPGVTEVWTREEMTYAGQPVDVIAIDPESFAAVAFWDDAFADKSLEALVDAIDEGASADGTVPAILVGDAAETGELSNPNNQEPPQTVEVVAHADAFPGAGKRFPTLITTIDAVDDGPLRFRHYVWVAGSYEEWRLRLQELGAQPMLGISRDDAVDSSVLRFATWSFDFVRALGVFVGLLAFAALMLHLAARQRQQALGYAFLRRMGVSRRRHWWALILEVGGLMAIVVSLGAGLALACVRMVSPNVDPLPIRPPDPLMVVPWSALVAVGVMGVVVTLLGSAVAQAFGARVDVAEVLRDGT